MKIKLKKNMKMSKECTKWQKKITKKRRKKTYLVIKEIIKISIKN